MIIEKLQQFAEAVSVRLYVKRPAPMEQDWRLDNWQMPCFVAIPSQESETVQETSGRVERRDFELMALRSVDVTFDTAEADAETEIARTHVLDFAQQIRGVFHVEHLGGRQIWDSANGELIVGWSLRLRLTELVGESACGGEPEPSEIEITENGTYNVLPFGRAVVDVQGGSPAVVEPLEVTPDTEAHTFNPPEGVDGFAPVEVDAVTASIDPNIQASNIKSGVSILGVAGTMEPKPTGKDVFGWTYQGQHFYLTSDGNILDTVANSGVGSWDYIEMPECKTLQRITVGNSATKVVKVRKCYYLGQQCTGTYIEHLEVGVLTGIYGVSWMANPTAYLRHFEVGQDTDIAINCSRWTATAVIAEGQDAIDELNYNIKTFIADRVADRTGDSALTITFGASLYNVLTPETIATFTAKNWSVASA